MAPDYSDPNVEIDFNDRDLDWEDSQVFSRYVATLDQTNKNEQLWTQAAFGDIEKAKICIAAGANPKSKSGGELTSPLSRACIKNQADMVNFLAPLSNLYSADLDGDTAAHRCCISGHHACLQALIDAGAKLNKANKKGEIAIFEALRYGAHSWNPPPHSPSMADHARCLDILIPLSNLEAANASGQTPIQIARGGELHALADFIASHIAQREKSLLARSAKRATLKAPAAIATGNSTPRI